MSYSFIKNVFPKFESSNSNASLYNEAHLNSDHFQNFIKDPPKPSGSLNDELEKHQFSPLKKENTPSFYGNAGKIQTPRYELKVEHFEDTQNAASLDSLKNPGGDNLRFYNLPAPTEFIDPYQNYDEVKNNIPLEPRANSRTSMNEHFSNGNCEQYITHMKTCQICKQHMQKYLDSSSKRQEIMELLSYILLGVFLLMILNKK